MTPPAVPLCPACALRENRFTLQIVLASALAAESTAVVESPPPPPVPPAPPVEPAASLSPVGTYSVSEAAEVLGVKPPTIYRLIARRILKPVPGIRYKRLSKRRVEAYLNSTEL